jgi:hypothetical protein
MPTDDTGHDALHRASTIGQAAAMKQHRIRRTKQGCLTYLSLWVVQEPEEYLKVAALGEKAWWRYHVSAIKWQSSEVLTGADDEANLCNHAARPLCALPPLLRKPQPGAGHAALSLDCSYDMTCISQHYSKTNMLHLNLVTLALLQSLPKSAQH